MRRKVVAIIATLVAGAVIAGCGSTRSSTTSATGAGGSGASQGANTSAPPASQLQAKAQAVAASYMKPPKTFPGMSPAYDPGHGKAIVIACGFDVPGCVGPANEAVQGLRAMGWTTGPPEDGQTSVSTESNLVVQAAQEHVDGLILVGVDVNTISDATAQAVKAGVRIVCFPCNSGSKWKGKVVDVTPNWYKAGEISAWEILALEGSHAKTWQVNDAEFSAVQLRAAGTEHVMQTECPECSLTTTEVTASETAQPGPPPWTAYLASHPAGTLTDAIGEYDGIAIPMANTDVSDGRSTIQLGGYDGDRPNLTALATGKPAGIAWTVAFPYYEEGWIAANVLGRWKAGLSLPTNLTNDALVLITKANVAQYIKGNPVGTAAVYPAPPNWEHAFEKTWGRAS